jgi:hypothetical protein
VRLVTDYSVTRWGFAVAGMTFTRDRADAPDAWTTLALDVQSPHPYADRYDESWDVAAPAGATEIRLHFARIDTEARYDFVEVYDATGALVGRWDGAHEDVLTAVVPGRTARVRLVTDYSVTRWGFHLDRLEHRSAR